MRSYSSQSLSNDASNALHDSPQFIICIIQMLLAQYKAPQIIIVLERKPVAFDETPQLTFIIK